MHKKSGPVDTSRGYELEDLPIKGVIKGTLIFFFFTTVSAIAALGYLAIVPQGLSGRTTAAPSRTLPPKPNPLLQDNLTAIVDLWQMRDSERKRLGSVGWVDKRKGVVHIPIESAIERAAGGSR